jgi:dihydrofolate synthase/folylpolyglutamate synthase
VPIQDAAVMAGLSEVRWPVRIEVLRTEPIVLVDAAHNWASTEALLATLDKEFSRATRRILVFAATREKDVAGMLRILLPRFDCVVLTQYQTNPRGVPVEELAATVQATSPQPCHLALDAGCAWRLASHLASSSDLICVTGSFFIAAEMRDLILDQQAARTRSGLADPGAVSL